MIRTGSIQNLEAERAVDEVLELGTWYKHCVGCQIVYNGNYQRPLLNLNRLGVTDGLTEIFLPYNITSGFCPPCYEDAISEFADKANSGREE